VPYRSLLHAAFAALLALGLLVVAAPGADAAASDTESLGQQMHDFAHSSRHTRSPASARDGSSGGLKWSNHSTCALDDGSDPIDSGALDISAYTGGFDCDEGFWGFGVSTYDAWALSELEYYAAFLDTDGDPTNGCEGWDMGVITFYDGAFESSTIHTPTCDENGWTSGPAGAASTTTHSIAIATSEAEVGSSSVRWAVGISSIYGDFDRAPNGTTVTSLGRAAPAPTPTPTPTPTPGPTASGAGYVLLSSQGSVFAYGNAHDVGSGTGLCASVSCASIAVRPNFDGYWISNASCAVGNFGGAPSVGSPNLGAPCALERTSTGNGYWAVTPGGSVAAEGDAAPYGSAPPGLNAPIVDVARTRTGNGYWLLGQDGGIFTFGAAPFFGSTGAMILNQPVVGMTPTKTGNGYWLVAADGGIFTFGDAAFHGSTGAITLNRPIIGMVTTPSGNGYWLVAADGGIFTFGDAGFLGSPAGNVPAPSIVAFAGP
jgi:hypothetical protein